MFQNTDFCFRTYGEVDNGNIPPIPIFDWSPINPKINQTVTFDASASYDPD